MGVVAKHYDMKLFVVTHCFHYLGHVSKYVPRCKKCYRIGPWPLFACVLIQPFLLGSCLFPFLCIPRPYFPWVEILYHMQTNKTNQKAFASRRLREIIFFCKTRRDTGTASFNPCLVFKEYDRPWKLMHSCKHTHTHTFFLSHPRANTKTKALHTSLQYTLSAVIPLPPSIQA